MSGYQLKVTIENTKPPVWRRLEIPDRITFRSLHDILQEAFGWQQMHLHGFSFQNTKIMVGDGHDYDCDEDKLLADDFLRSGWIRYVYDYGDDWRHKIVMEKELPDYEKRYSRVIKFKGNNFEEDSGGAGGAFEAEANMQIPYDLDAVNDRLSSFVCPEQPDAATAGEYGINVNQKKEERAKRAGITQMLDDFGQLLREVWREGEWAPIDYLSEQMEEVWYDLEEQQDYKLGSSQKRISEILQADGMKHLFELQKYLAVQDASRRSLIKNMAEVIAAALKEHPEYLVYMFDISDLRQYVHWFRKREASQFPEHYILMGFALLGLAEPRLEWEKKKPHLYIDLPQDAESIVEFLETQKLEELERQENRLWERIYGMVMCYGYIEIQALHEQYTKLFGDISRKDFERCLYLCGRFRGQIVTGMKNSEGEMEPWVGISGDAAEAVAKKMPEAVVTDVEYKSFTRKQVLEMTRLGYTAVYPQWDILFEVLCHMDMEEWEAEEMLEFLYEQVQTGEGMKTLLAEFDEDKELIQPDDWAIMEHALCRCWSETGTVLLKGYSRLEIARAAGKDLFTVASDDGYKLLDYVEKNSEEADADSDRHVDPDAFCPCGSGKRYRQCCGRKK